MVDQGKIEFLDHDEIEKEKETIIVQSVDNNKSIESTVIKYPSTNYSSTNKYYPSIGKQQVSDAKVEKLKKKIGNLGHLVKEETPSKPNKGKIVASANNGHLSNINKKKNSKR